MDIISQLQEQANTIAALAFNTFGSLQRDAPPVRLSPNYPEPPAVPSAEDAAKFADDPKLMSSSLVKAAKQFDALVAALPLSDGGEEAQLKRIAQLQVLFLIMYFCLSIYVYVYAVLMTCESRPRMMLWVRSFRGNWKLQVLSNYMDRFNVHTIKIIEV